MRTKQLAVYLATHCYIGSNITC